MFYHMQYQTRKDLFSLEGCMLFRNEYCFPTASKCISWDVGVALDTTCIHNDTPKNEVFLLYCMDYVMYDMESYHT